MIILTWNRDKEDVWPISDYEATREKCLKSGSVKAQWSVGKHKNIPKGSELFFLVQGSKFTRGLVASGFTTSVPFSGEHWDDSSKTTNYVKIQLTNMLPLDDTIPVDLLEQEIPKVSWRYILGSGFTIPDESQEALRSLWTNFSGETEIPEAGELTPKKYIEGGFRTIRVNRYERDPAARRASLAHHGKACFACGIDLEAVYGQELGTNAIHVHHIQPMSTRSKKPYRIDPIKDLIPLCPNCHNVVHKVDPVLSPVELRKIFRERNIKK